MELFTEEQIPKVCPECGGAVSWYSSIMTESGFECGDCENRVTEVTAIAVRVSV